MQEKAAVRPPCLRASVASAPEDWPRDPPEEVATRRESLSARTLPAYYAPGTVRERQDNGLGDLGERRAEGLGGHPATFLNSSPKLAAGNRASPRLRNLG